MRHRPAQSLHHRNRTRRAVGAFTLVEVIVSLGIVGVLLVAAIRVSASVRLASRINAQRATASALADEMMAQVNVAPAAASAAVSAPPSGGGGLVTGLVGSVLQLLSGVTSVVVPSTPEPAVPAQPTGDWTRKVAVEWVNAASPTTVSATSTGLRRITVTVLYKNNVVLQRVAFRATDVD